ncbi:HU family DNA-binding protein [Nitrospinaceae bacterium]|nr:HU family DNA-binding protein [Nitrospinaceae bacterium]
MTRVQLVEKIAYRMKVTKKDADTYLTAFLDSIMDTLAKDRRVVVQGFGSFKINEYKARVAKKPLTGVVIHLPVRHKPSFHAGKELRERVNKEMKSMHKTEELIRCLTERSDRNRCYGPHAPENALEATMG